jgi:hypothetical protein
VKHSRVKQGKMSKGSGERARSPHTTTLAELLALIDAAADDKQINDILSHLSSGTRAILYSALRYTEASLPAPSSAEKQPRNRSYALQFLREFLL